MTQLYLYNEKIQRTSQYSYYSLGSKLSAGRTLLTRSSCRETQTNLLIGCARRKKNYNFLMEIKKRYDGAGEVAQQVSDILNLGITVKEVGKNLYLFGNLENLQQFNIGINFLFYVVKIGVEESWLFNKDTISKKMLVSGQRYASLFTRCMTGFFWYLVYVKEFPIPLVPVDSEDLNRMNGTASFVRNVLIKHYPDAARHLSEYLDTVRGGKNVLSEHGGASVVTKEGTISLRRLVCSD